MKNGFNNFFYQSKAFNDVISGKFPEDAVKKMTLCRLQGFVVNLVKYTEAGTKSVSMVNYKKKPSWWPSDVIFENDLLTSEVKTKQIRVTLRQLIINCCEFFKHKSFKQIWLPAKRTKTVWINDENFESVKTRGVKRKKDISGGNGAKKRKTLTNKNESTIRVQQTVDSSIDNPVKAVVYLQDIFKSPKIPVPLSQQQFLNSLGLSFNNNSAVSSSAAPHSSKLIKLHHCPQVPISSDVGKAMIKRENYIVPEYSTAKKIERLEWYVNRSPPKKTPQHYEITYVESKRSDIHTYKFPKKQFHPSVVNEQYMSILMKLCKPFSVVVKRQDLVALRKSSDNSNFSVTLHKLSTEQLNKYVCRDIKVRLPTTLDKRLRPRNPRIFKQ